jgi:hypothetical protein
MAKFAAKDSNKNITLSPHGTGKVVVGTGAADATVQSDGNHNLVLQTGNSTTGSISITDGADGNIDLTPNGTGEVNISKVDIDSGTVDGLSQLTVDNLQIDANKISSTNTNGDIELAPNGTGDVNIIDPNTASQQSEQNFKIGRAEVMVSSQGETVSSGYTAGYTFKTYDHTGGSSFTTRNALVLGANGDATVLAKISASEAQTDNINIDGNAITSTNTNGNIDLTPNGTGEVNISKVDIDAGTIDGTDVTVGAGKTLNVSAGTLTTSTAQKDGIVDGSTAISRSGNNLTFAGTIENTGLHKINAGNVQFYNAGYGPVFGSTVSTSNTLDDYEEGTFTPAFSSTDASWTTDSANGFYTKIGDLVVYSFWLKTTAISGTTSNSLSITGLPFSSISSSNYYGFTSINYVYNWNMGIGAGQFPGWRHEQGVARLDAFRNINNDLPAFIPASSTNNSDCRVVLGGAYRAA